MLSETRKVAKHHFPVVRNQQPVFTSGDGKNFRVGTADDTRIPGSLEIDSALTPNQAFNDLLVQILVGLKSKPHLLVLSLGRAPALSRVGAFHLRERRRESQILGALLKGLPGCFQLRIEQRVRPARLVSQLIEVCLFGPEILVNLIAMGKIICEAAIDLLQVQRRERLCNTFRRLTAQEPVDDGVERNAHAS